jgi:hypothetical protein
MEIAAKNSIHHTSFATTKSISLTEKFTEYCKGLEDHRILLLAFTLIFQGCIAVPATLLVTSFFDMGMGGITISLLAAGTVGVLVSNMAELSVKVILITFILTTVTNLVLLVMHLFA